MLRMNVYMRQHTKLGICSLVSFWTNTPTTNANKSEGTSTTNKQKCNNFDLCVCELKETARNRVGAWVELTQAHDSLGMSELNLILKLVGIVIILIIVVVVVRALRWIGRHVRM